MIHPTHYDVIVIVVIGGGPIASAAGWATRPSLVTAVATTATFETYP